MRKEWLAALAVFAIVVLTTVVWLDRPSTFSHANCERICPGMGLADVQRLLGSPGTETFESCLPGVVDWNVPVTHPKRVKPVVSGEQYFRWDDAEGAKIIISLRDGVVAEKWYWKPSL